MMTKEAAILNPDLRIKVAHVLTETMQKLSIELEECPYGTMRCMLNVLATFAEKYLASDVYARKEVMCDFYDVVLGKEMPKKRKKKL